MKPVFHTSAAGSQLNYRTPVSGKPGGGCIKSIRSTGQPHDTLSHTHQWNELSPPFLSSLSPLLLRSVFRQLTQVDPDALWLTLNELHCPHSYTPPHPDLQPVVLSGQGSARDEFTDNVLRLLEEFDLPQKHL